MPRKPITCQTSVTVALDLGSSMLRITGFPAAARRGVPSASKTGQFGPSQVALRMPLANRHLPVTR